MKEISQNRRNARRQAVSAEPYSPVRRTSKPRSQRSSTRFSEISKIGIIGCGHMGGAIAKALIAKKIGTLAVSSPHRPSLHVKWTVDNRQLAKTCDIIIVAVKPGMVPAILKEIAADLKAKQILISVAAGIPLKKLIQCSNGHQKTVRVLPNLPAQISEGVSIWKASSQVSATDKKKVACIFETFGKSIEVKNEDLINSGCAVSGCGPAFCAAFLETFSAFAKTAGFTAAQARLISLQMAAGSISYMAKTGSEFDALSRAVQTKGGTTEAAFNILKRKKWQQILTEALQAAYRRTQEIASS